MLWAYQGAEARQTAANSHAYLSNMRWRNGDRHYDEATVLVLDAGATSAAILTRLLA